MNMKSQDLPLDWHSLLIHAGTLADQIAFLGLTVVLASHATALLARLYAITAARAQTSC
jgi:hypothetical protein